MKPAWCAAFVACLGVSGCGQPSPWEAGHRVPTILSWPGSIEPGVSDALGWTIDVMPTVLGWTRIDYTGDQDGIDLAPAIAANEPMRV